MAFRSTLLAVYRAVRARVGGERFRSGDLLMHWMPHRTFAYSCLSSFVPQHTPIHLHRWESVDAVGLPVVSEAMGPFTERDAMPSRLHAWTVRTGTAAGRNASRTGAKRAARICAGTLRSFTIAVVLATRSRGRDELKAALVPSAGSGTLPYKHSAPAVQ